MTMRGRWAKGQSANHATQWKPGFCPNPKGRPSIPKAWFMEGTELTRQLCELFTLMEAARPRLQTVEDDALALELINSLRSLGVRVSVVGGLSSNWRVSTGFYETKLQLKPVNKIPRKMLLRIIEAKPVLIEALRHRHAGCVPTCHENGRGGWTHCPKDGCMSLPGELLEQWGLLPRSRAKKIVL